VRRARPWALLTALLLLATPLRAGDDVEAGVDLWTTPGTGLTFDDFSGNPIPAGFFGLGSDPFTGRVELGGQPLPDLGGPTAPSVSPADTIVRRTQAASLPGSGSEDTVPIEIVGLSLVGTGPILVTYDGGQSPELWSVAACLSSVLAQRPGSMTLRRQCPGGGSFAGVFNSTLPVIPKLVFVREGDGAIRTLDPAPQLTLTTVGAPWVELPDPSLQVIRIPAGAVTDGDCDGLPDPQLPGTSNFVAGVRDLSCDPACTEVPEQPQQKVLSAEEEVLAAHGILPAQVPPPDGDFDGLPDDADNCPEDFNPLQEDADGDHVGDLCDNCVSTYNPCQEDADMDGVGDACETLIFTDGFESGDASAWSLSVP